MAKPGVLLARWTKKRSEGPSFGVTGDLMYEWGEGCSKADGALLHNVLASKRARPNFLDRVFPVAFDPSLAEELIARGYDITTIRFSIKKKRQPLFSETPDGQ